ncbi:MAG: hypothetical protein Q9166_005606 [cf. Caloplaca sp. 2 TL-2023]
MASHSAFDTHLADQKVKILVNAQLKSILKREGLPVSGVKAAMQGRIIDLRPMFKESPFYTILQHLTPVQECKAIVREATRDTVECKIVFKLDVADKLGSDPSTRVMIFCAPEPISHFSRVDIAFPHQVEIKVNLDEVKANLRGLKNRAGSTRPADITDLLRKRANYENTMSLTYALTHKKFYFIVNLVKRHSVEELVTKLKSGKTISKDQVIRESKFLESLSVARYAYAEISGHYVDEILKSTPRSIDQVTVEPDGKWSRISEGDSSPRPKHDSSGDDEDLVEIKDPPRLTAVKNEMTNGPSFMRTPPTSSREQSTTSSVPPPSAGAKRSASAVIDLTSDDDDEESRRLPKRPATSAYPATPTYSSSENGRPKLGGNDGNPFGSFTGNLPPKPNYIQRGFPHQ